MNQGEDLHVEFGGGGFIAPTPEACETECFVRNEHCGAWSFIFNPEEGEIKWNFFEMIAKM